MTTHALLAANMTPTWFILGVVAVAAAIVLFVWVATRDGI